jgi:2-methylisocitrate lyase-like PEP mutase family enzyme
MTPETTQQQAEVLHSLHAPGKPLVLVNAWDAVSARVIEEAGAPAIATTSAGMAWSLGYSDGERLPREELLAACARIRRVVRGPFTVDLERGYGRTVAEVVSLVRALLALGVVGINIEDGREDGRLVPSQQLCERIAAIRALAEESGVRLFINARTDAYFAAKLDPARRFDEALDRARLFAAAGADGIFVPGMGQLEEIARFARAISLPFNVYAGYPGVPTLAALAAAGVRRVSLGCGPLQSALALVRRIAQEALSGGPYEAMASGMVSVGELNGLLETDRAAPA